MLYSRYMEEIWLAVEVIQSWDPPTVAPKYAFVVFHQRLRLDLIARESVPITLCRGYCRVGSFVVHVLRYRGGLN